MLLPLESCTFSEKNYKVQRPNILCWTFALRTSVADVICAGDHKLNDQLQHIIDELKSKK
jgi:hypothetical protein